LLDEHLVFPLRLRNLFSNGGLQFGQQVPALLLALFGLLLE
jgi:hypothetical protein